MIEFIEEFLNDWTTADGGGMLDPNDREPPIEGDLERTNNQNAILFLVQPAFDFVEMFPAFKGRLKAKYDTHMGSTEIEPGLHARWRGGAHLIRQSHDNLIGMLVGSWLFDSDYGEKIFQYGSKNRWCFNVGAPGVYDVKCQLQGGDIAIAHLATGRKPAAWYVLWLAIGLMNPVAYNLADLRIRFLEKVMHKLDFAERMLLNFAIDFHKRKRGPVKNYNYTRFGYYRPAHPFTKFQQAVYMPVGGK